MNTIKPINVIMSLAVLTGTVLVNTSWGQETLVQGEKREITSWAVKGRVLDPNGKPVVGARVWASNNQPYQTAVTSQSSKIVWRMIGRSDVEVEPSDLGPFSQGPVRTDAGGRFLVKNIASPMDGFVSIVHPDYLPMRQEVVRKKGEEAKDGLLDVATLTLTRGLDIAGRVLDAEGQPISGANVAIVRPIGRWGGNPEPVKWAQSDREGRFVMRGVSPKDKGLMLGAWTASRPADSVKLTGGKSQKDLVLTLAQANPANRIRGRVINAEDGSPMVGCMVRLMLMGDQGPFNRQTYDRARTDNKGRVEFDCVPEGEYVLEATPADQVPLIGRYNPPPWSVSRTCEPGADLELALLPPIQFLGAVKDATTGKPVTRFAVNAHYDFRAYTKDYRAKYGSPDSQRLADGPHVDGQFALPNMRTGEWTIRVISHGYVPLVKVVQMELGARKGRETLELQPATGEAAGLVVDAGTGKPIEGALVDAYEWSQRNYGANRRYCNSDSKGQFRSTRLILDETLVQKFWISKDGYLQKELVFKKGELPPKDLGKVELVRECVLTGKLLDADGKPLDRVSLELRSSTGRSKGGRTALTNLGGSYRFAGLAAGHYTLWVRNKKVAKFDFDKPGTVLRDKPRKL